MEYVPAPVPPGKMKLADALPTLTVDELTGEPTWTFDWLKTVKVTAPALTVPPPLVTVADRVTAWLLVLKVADAAPAVVTVGAFTVNVCVLSLLVRRFVVPPKTAWIV